MEKLNDRITVQCSECQFLEEVYISHIIEDKGFPCSNCFSFNTVDVEKLLTKLEALMKKVDELKKRADASGKALFPLLQRSSPALCQENSPII